MNGALREIYDVSSDKSWISANSTIIEVPTHDDMLPLKKSQEVREGTGKLKNGITLLSIAYKVLSQNRSFQNQVGLMDVCAATDHISTFRTILLRTPKGKSCPQSHFQRTVQSISKWISKQTNLTGLGYYGSNV